ncbi:hypothetical protein CYMTET_56211 [Cymbomonas tetramitiformis]|uniref:Uncharacterized protein n=1 Tax=Cymbomonas tetramitiformis TaxID=36881 RepID=A0AAE0ENZ7_9CHLO|nr:hypothetical protein CYMTET_56211 [Cymbomonas tetramitiformis]
MAIKVREDRGRKGSLRDLVAEEVDPELELEVDPEAKPETERLCRHIYMGCVRARLHPVPIHRHAPRARGRDPRRAVGQALEEERLWAPASEEMADPWRAVGQALEEERLWAPASEEMADPWRAVGQALEEERLWEPASKEMADHLLEGRKAAGRAYGVSTYGVWQSTYGVLQSTNGVWQSTYGMLGRQRLVASGQEDRNGLADPQLGEPLIDTGLSSIHVPPLRSQDEGRVNE